MMKETKLRNFVWHQHDKDLATVQLLCTMQTTRIDHTPLLQSNNSLTSSCQKRRCQWLKIKWFFEIKEH